MSLRIRGEYWIEESGDLLYADGDVSDSNHESFAQERAMQLVAEHFGLEDDDYDFHNFNEVLSKEIEESLPDWEAKFGLPWIAAWHLIQENGDGPSQLVLQTACGVVANSRIVAFKEWKWISIQRNQIVTEEFNPIVAKRLYDALGEAFFEEGVELNDEMENEITLNIFVNGQGKELSLSMSELKAESLPRAEDPMVEAAGRIANNTLTTMDKENLHPSYKRQLGD